MGYFPLLYNPRRRTRSCCAARWSCCTPPTPPCRARRWRVTSMRLERGSSAKTSGCGRTCTAPSATSSASLRAPSLQCLLKPSGSDAGSRCRLMRVGAWRVHSLRLNNTSSVAALARDTYGDLHAACRRCHHRFNLSAPPVSNRSTSPLENLGATGCPSLFLTFAVCGVAQEKSCGYHPGELTCNGYTCCGVVPRVGSSPVWCHWRPHVA